MSSLPTEPDHLDEAPPTKRRRIALSCIDCRKRKLKCDREYPICSRCREGRHPERCTYDPNAVEEIISKPLVPNGTTTSKEDAPSVNKGSSSTNRQLNGDASKSTFALENRIEQLENRIIGLERIISLSSKVEDRGGAARLYSSKTWNEVSGNEFLEFRGKGCGTSFHGASHPQSYLSQVRNLAAFQEDYSDELVRCPRYVSS